MRFVLAVVLLLCFVGIPLLLFAFWFLEIGRAAHWEPGMCLMTWVPGLFFVWVFAPMVPEDDAPE